jgi:hypothetical protein
MTFPKYLPKTMTEIHALTPRESKALRQFECARDQAVRRELVRLGALARVRITRVIASGLDPARRPQLRLLTALSRRAATGYERLEHIDGAIRFARRLARKALRRAGVAPMVTS